MQTGRPTDYKQEYCDKVIEFMSDGASLTEFAADIDVHRDTIYEWATKHLEFSDALKKAKIKCQAWWERTGRRSMLEKPKDFDTAMWIFSMKSRFGASDQAPEKSNYSQDYETMYEEKRVSEK